MSLSYEDLFQPFHVAMKPPSAWRIGAEAEKFGIYLDTGAAVPYEGEKGIVAVLGALEKRFGWKPIAESAGGPLIALERARASVTLEPGGQLELSGAPLDDVHAIVAETRAHLTELNDVCAPLGIAWLGIGFHPFARQEDLPWVPKMRYGIMREYLPTRGSRPLDMMRRTATVQANFDYESEDDAMRKMRVLLRLSVIGTAMFANSPFYEGRLTGDKSERAKVWLSVDSDRQGLLPALWKQDSRIRDYVEWALDVPMFLVKREGGRIVRNTGQTFRRFWQDGFQGEKPDLHDWELHLNTLFPEVRLKHTIEVRGGDSQTALLASAVPALWTGVLYDSVALDQAEALGESFTYDEMQALRPEIAKHGMGARFRGRSMVETAQRLVAIATDGLARRKRMSQDGQDEAIHLAALAKLVEHGLSPADELTRSLPEDPRALRTEIVRRARL
jgi:glutamate--cysteine ligase